VFFAAVVGASAQSVTTIATFNGTNGWGPSTLVQGFDGNLYGPTSSGINATSDGSIYKVTPAGLLTTVYRFCSKANCADGSGPSILLLAANGNFYGMTGSGGAYNRGTVFELTSAGKLVTLYSFCAQFNCTDGETPGTLLLANNGSLYGTTLQGGVSNHGTIFEITAGKLTTLYSFCSQTDCRDGAMPYGLMQATNGNLYGTTAIGGRTCTLSSNKGCGTVFELTPSGKLHTLYAFCSDGGTCADGALPEDTLIQASNGNFYGTTSEGGNYIGSTGFSAGTVFEITAEGKLTTQYSFCPQNICTGGAESFSSLVQGTDGNLYGTTYEPGEVFQLTPQDEATSYPIGWYTNAGVIQATNGSFYGTNNMDSYGFIYTLSLGLTPFVETLPTAGKPGAKVVILGSNLTGTTSVTFNGTAATYTVVSDTEIAAAVPEGATAGTVEVVIPGGMLNSNVTFRVVE
jgi:uncharacterized repeat protein (TIGR03803 family)